MVILQYSVIIKISDKYSNFWLCIQNKIKSIQNESTNCYFSQIKTPKPFFSPPFFYSFAEVWGKVRWSNDGDKNHHRSIKIAVVVNDPYSDTISVLYWLWTETKKWSCNNKNIFSREVSLPLSKWSRSLCYEDKQIFIASTISDKICLLEKRMCTFNRQNVKEFVKPLRFFRSVFKLFFFLKEWKEIIEN